MHLKLLTTCITAALVVVACGKDEPQPGSNPASGGSSAAAPSQPQGRTPSTPANTAPPQSMAEKREGANPVQGQVDPKERVQHKDFQQRGDGAGPKSAETAPGPGK